MKLILSLVAVVMIGYSATAQTAKTAKTKEAKPVAVEAKSTSTEKAAVSTEKSVNSDGITFKAKEISKADIKYAADETFTFEFKNTSKTPLIISNVQTSCGCTTANKPTEPVQPGKSSEISVKYDTKRVGPFTKTITVTTNIGEPVVLTIKGNVLAQETNNSAN